MEEAEFWDKYWKKNTEIITVVNPRNEDYIFQAMVDTGFDQIAGKSKIEARHYKVAAGGNERFPGPIANIYLDQMAKLIAQDEDNIQHMSDFALRAQYYDDLIVSIEDLIKSYEAPTPDYLNRPTAEPVETKEDKPFAGVEQPKKVGRPPKAKTEA